ncbi:MAG TPA: hypothetical protein VJS20_04605 [Gemmatimonadales bacterium]|nr:hypothetical protein [Gemmatimonadales bacterium]
MERSKFFGAMTLAVLGIAAMAGDASAQQQITQTITWTNSNQTGMTGWSGPTFLCVANNRTVYNSNAPLGLAWTDTTGAIVNAVRVDLSINWQYLYNPLPVFNISINGVQQPGTLNPNGTQTNCSANTLTQTSYETGITSWNPMGANTLTITPTTTTYACLNVNQSFMVQIVVTQLNLPPADPTNPVQVGPDGKTIPVGGVCAGSTVRLRATVADPDNDDCFLEAEFQPTSVFFTQEPNFGGNPAPAGQNAIVDVTGVSPGSYHWAIRTVDPFDFRSNWISFGNNSEIVADVIVDSAVKPPPPIDAVNHGGGDCEISTGAGSGWLPPALLGLIVLAFGLARLRR